jgi:hypothetical protein
VQSLEEGTRDWPGATIAITEGDDTMFRPAAFVFDVPGGVAWVEPNYADPAGASSPGFHVWRGDRKEWSVFTRPNGSRLSVLRYDQDHRDLIGDALDWFADWLKAEGRTWAEERERVRALVADELV